MFKIKEILRPKKLAKGGAFLPHLKESENIETVVMPTVQTVKIPLSQHIGAPASAVVKKGDKVFVGTLIAEASAYVSADVHSSVSGTVVGIENLKGSGECIVIESDGEMQPDPEIKPFSIKTKKDLVEAAKKCGLVGLGGAGFPAAVKLNVNSDTKIDTLIINAAECEPYITSDCRECLENYEDVINGVYLVKDALNVDNVIICVESNKKPAIEKLYQIASDVRDEDNSVRLMMLPTRYPQGAEKVIVYSATGRKVPAGKLPSDVGCVVMNVTSVATLYRFSVSGMPLVKKRLTVDGTAVNEPKNVMVPIGTPIKELLQFVGNIDENAAEIIMGGPMMGIDVYSPDAVIEKRNNAITVMKAETKPLETTACIRCGRCAATCPMRLYPAAVETAVSFNNIEKLKELNLNYCMECGCCSFACPASRPLTQTMRQAKAILRKEQSK